VNVKLVSLTKSAVEGVETAEQLIVYTARVSNPDNQMNMETAPKLLSYLIKNQHWSPFEQASMGVEIQTSRGIAAQILRHRSFTFSEFSMRYASPTDAEVYPARRQDNKNRQNSIDDMDEKTQLWFKHAQQSMWYGAATLYDEAVSKGIAKEQARFLLPLGVKTTLYMSGTIRSWIHYLQLRTGNGTQKEHKDIADAIKTECFVPNFPSTALALEWL
jgi:thymidylate synthase (FAD)